MEKPQPQETGLYRDRVSSESYIEYWLERIQAVEAGEEVLDISENDMQEILEEESELGERVEELYHIGIMTLNIHTSFFLTEEGTELLSKTLDVDPKEIPKDENKLIEFFYLNTEKIAKLKKADYKKLSSKSLSFEKSRLKKEIQERYTGGSDFSLEGIDVSKKITLILNPETLQKKDEGLRSLKEELKQKMKAILDKDNPSQRELGQIEIYSMYIERINILITNNYTYRFSLGQKAEAVGLEGLTEPEKSMIKAKDGNFFGKSAEQRESHAARIDKFVRGAEPIELSDDSDFRRQLSAELRSYAEKIEKLWQENESKKITELTSRGLDPKKITNTESISADLRLSRLRELYKQQGILSEVEEYSSKRVGPAPDNKWQLNLKPGAKAHKIRNRQKVHFVPETSCDVVKHICVDLGHEPTHVMQHENKSRVAPLRLFDEVGGGRESVIKEGGAKKVENYLSLKIFGYENIPHPHYLRAMEARVEGGNYLDTVKAFLVSAMKPYEDMLSSGEIDKDLYRQILSENITIAIDRCMRLFRNGGDYHSKSGFLTTTKTLAYLEQRALQDKLNGTNLEPIFYVAGVSIENYYRLRRLGLLNPEEIKRPNTDFAEQIWEEIKEEYELA